MSELPKGWAPATISDVAVARMGKTIIAHELVESGLPVYSANRDDGPWGFVASSDLVFDKGTIVVSARGTIGFIRLPTDERFISTQTTIALRPLPAVVPEFLRYSLRRVDWAPVTSTTTIPMLTIGQINEVDAPLAPLNEQRRIVEKLDAVFEKSRAAKARLERLPALLEKLKRSILAAAFRGDLTKDWRAAHPDVEPASVLLERIRAERRRRWEEGLRAKGKDPKKATYEEPAPVDVAGLPELPEGWAWASLETVCPVFIDCAHRTPKYSDEGFAALRPRDVVGGLLRLDTAARVPLDEFRQQTERRVPQAGDIIYSRELSLGWGVEVPDHAQVCMSQGMVLFRPSTNVVHAGFFLLALNGGVARSRAEAAAVGSAHPHLNLGEIKSLPFPIAPLAEQEVAFERAQERIALVRRLAARRDAVVARGIRLEQAALAKAFRGELVPQDPTDEPASVLLDRIRAARADEPQRARRGRPARPADPELFAAKPAAPRATNGHGAEAEEGEPVDLVVAAFQLAPRLTATAIGSTTGLDAASVKKALKALVDGGQVRVEGKARGTAYVWRR
jgi:type I restriction enzyme S subunit